MPGSCGISAWNSGWSTARDAGLPRAITSRPGSSPRRGGVEPWLAAGSVTVQQEALRDLDQAWRNFFAGTHRRPRWRKQGSHEGFRIVGKQAWRIENLNRRWSRVLVPKVGWVRFRRSRDIPRAKSYRVTLDSSSRWHIAFAAVPEPVPDLAPARSSASTGAWP